MMSSPYRFPSIRPSVPASESWTPFLRPSYAAKWFSNFGPVVRQFEARLTERLCHRDEIITSANSCTSGIAAALIALKIEGPVLIPAYTFPATVSAVLMSGCEPWIVDVDLETWCMSTVHLEHGLAEKNYDAVVLVVPFGVRQDFSKHFALCAKHGAAVIIDNASGLDAKETPLPHERCFEVYSLHATKSFPIGEGGVIRSFATHAEALQRALNFGLQGGLAQAGCWGINGKLPEFSAAVGLAVLDRFDEVVAHRQSVAGRYIDVLTKFENLAYPRAVDKAPWQLFPLLLPSASLAHKFTESAASKSFQVRRGYHPSLEDWPRTRKVALCPNAQSLAERMVLLPVYSDSTEAETGEMMRIVGDCLRDLLGD